MRRRRIAKIGPPSGLQGPRSGRAGWSVRSWPAASATPAQQLPHRVPVDSPWAAGDRCASYRVFLPLGLRGGRGAGLTASGRAAGEAAARCGLSCVPMCAGFSVAQKELGGRPEPVYPPDRRRSVPTRRTASCRLWRRWLLGGTALDTCYGAAGVSMWNQRERSPGPAPLMALIR